MPNRSHDWLAQAKRDLEHAEKDLRDAYYEYTCFEAQQAAEKAVKSVYLAWRGAGWGHRVAKLLQELASLGESAPAKLIDDGKILDQYHILARYPNGFESGTPVDFFTKEQSTDAVRRATDIIEWCEGIQGSRSG